MKIIYSFWDSPFNNKDSFRSVCGFRTKELFLSCAEKSILAAKDKVSIIELYCNKESLLLLKPILHLFNNVIKIEVNSEHTELFALSKFEAYKLQTEPFIHLDLDFIIKGELPTDYDFLVEHRENISIYTDVMFEYLGKFKESNYISNFYYSGLKGTLGCGMGIFGVNDLVFLDEYIKEFEKLKQQIIILRAGKPTYVDMIFIEQGLFALMYQKQKKKTVYLSDTNKEYLHFISTMKTLISTEEYLQL